MPTRPVLENIVFDEQGRLITNLPCSVCHYNLRTLAADSSCPECDTPVRATTDEFYLAVCDLGWLTTVQRGLSLLLIMPVVTMLGGVLLSWVVPTTPPARIADVLQVQLIPAAFSLLVAAITLLCFWWLTAPEPRRNPVAQRWTARRILRVCAVCGMITAICSFLLAAVKALFVSDSHSTLAVVLMVLVGLLMLFATTYSLAMPFAFLCLLRSFARRIPAPKLVQYASILLWSCIGVLVLMGCLQAVTFLGLAYSSRSAQQAGGPARVAVHLNAEQRRALAGGETFVAGAVDPNDPNGVYVIAMPYATDRKPYPNPSGVQVSLEPNASGVSGSVVIAADPNDPNQAVVISAAGMAGMMLPAGAMSPILFTVLAGMAGCVFLIYAVAAYVFLILIYRNFYRIIKAMKKRPQVAPAGAAGGKG